MTDSRNCAQLGTISQDPAEDDYNLYRYVKNNPVNRDDPSGLQDPDVVLVSADPGLRAKFESDPELSRVYGGDFAEFKRDLEWMERANSAEAKAEQQVFSDIQQHHAAIEADTRLAAVDVEMTSFLLKASLAQVSLHALPTLGAALRNAPAAIYAYGTRYGQGAGEFFVELVNPSPVAIGAGGAAITTLAGRADEIASATGKAAPRSELGDVAFGLWRHQSTGAGGQLDRFAGHVGARSYGDIYGTGILPTEEMLENMMYGASRLHINLEGLAKSVDELPDIVRLGSKGLDYQPSFGVGNITNWEIWRIHQDPELLKKAVFYLNGKVVTP